MLDLMNANGQRKDEGQEEGATETGLQRDKRYHEDMGRGKGGASATTYTKTDKQQGGTVLVGRKKTLWRFSQH